ncbi:PucR family transcriptional regulator [Halopolyspora algeriensis]|nr:helix-turn-helix domain-containing protein [Halopolyspora algeriensis]
MFPAKPVAFEPEPMRGAEGDPELLRIDALHTALTSIVLDGGNLDRIAGETSRLLELEVLFTTTDGRQWANALTDATTESLSERELLDMTGRARVERLAHPVGVHDGEILMVRVAAGGVELGRLIAVRCSGPIRPADVQALERAAAVAALLITREQAVTAVENKYQGDLLRDVLLGRTGDEQYVLHHTGGFGWDLQRPSVVIVAMLDRDSLTVDETQRRRWHERFAAGWRKVAQETDPAAACVDYSSEVVTIMPAATVDEAAEIVRQATRDVAGDRGGGRRPFSVGASRRTEGLHDLPEAYMQARRALDVARRTSEGSTIMHFDELGLHRLIALIDRTEELRTYVVDVLGPLAEDTEEAAGLRTTLQTLLDTNFNLAQAARELFFHYNTLRYRLSKLERLLGPLTTNPRLRLNVAVALQAYEFAH